MGKLIVTEFITVDGVIENPGGGEDSEDGGWAFRHPAPDGQQFKFEELQAADVQLLGRITYQGFAKAWPAMKGAGEFGEKMNAMPKVVVSATLTEAEAIWNNTTIISGEDLPAEIAGLKKRYDGDILVAGSATLVRSLAEHQLVDEYRLVVHPVVLGRGKRLFGDGFPVADLQLAGSRKVGPDVQLLTYRTATAPAAS